MLSQHAKWLKVTLELPWRYKIASLNYLLASHVWQQGHNGFTHQDPGFLDHVINKKADIVRVYLPPDANCLPSVYDHCLRSRHYVNVVIAAKHALPQWLSMDAAVVHCTEGIGICQWASNDQDSEPDVVMACCGDTPTLEILAAVSTLREHLPGLKIRVINVVDLMKLQPKSEHPHGLSDIDYLDGLCLQVLASPECRRFVRTQRLICRGREREMPTRLRLYRTEKLAVPRGSYSLSRRASRPGSAREARRTSACSVTGFSSRHTTGSWGSIKIVLTY
jgi:XFP C-terminal domain/D-xylulose 5-phosphate/D-fructose 6-phosphate phosphoketolase